MSSAYLPCSAPSMTAIDNSSKLYTNSTNIYNDGSSSNSNVNNRGSKYSQEESSTFFGRIHNSFGEFILSVIFRFYPTHSFSHSSDFHRCFSTYFGQFFTYPFFDLSFFQIFLVSSVSHPTPLLLSLHIALSYGISLIFYPSPSSRWNRKLHLESGYRVYAYRR